MSERKRNVSVMFSLRLMIVTRMIKMKMWYKSGKDVFYWRGTHKLPADCSSVAIIISTEVISRGNREYFVRLLPLLGCLSCRPEVFLALQIVEHLFLHIASWSQSCCHCQRQVVIIQISCWENMANEGARLWSKLKLALACLPQTAANLNPLLQQLTTRKGITHSLQ